MQLTDDQETALVNFMHWFKNDASQERVYCIDGSAGTGKTTLIKVICEALANEHRKCQVAAYTGKATYVLQSKARDLDTGVVTDALAKASTIHHMIYRPWDPAATRRAEIDEQLVTEEDPVVRLQLHEERDSLPGIVYNSLNRDAFEDERPDILIIDECSMVSEQIFESLLTFEIPILLVGDEFQLPPVKATPMYAKINARLDQVTRQVEGSPILHMARKLRYDKRLTDCGPNACIVSKVPGDWMHQFDQLLCGRNETRHDLNRIGRITLLQAPSPLPVVRDRLICLQNEEEGIFFNGSTWKVTDVNFTGKLSHFLVKMVPNPARTDADEPIERGLLRYSFKEGDSKEMKFIMKLRRFDYSYAITVHKAQGSEWNSVVLMDEWGFENRARWLYTAITRAKERLMIVKEA